MRRATLAVAALACLTLAGCGSLHVAPTASPDPATASGLGSADRFATAPANAPLPGPADAAWWRRFDQPALGQWVERALAHNLALPLAAARVDEARALLRGAQGARSLQVGATARVDASQRRGSSGRRVEPGAAMTLDWDADLWGGRRWAEASAEASLQQAGQQALATRLSVAALTARAYLAWQEARLDAAQIDASITLLRDVARIVQIRVDAGLAPPLDGQRARGELAATEAAAVDALARVQDTARALQLLAGEGAAAALQSPAAAEAPALPRLQGSSPVVLPLDLLRLRPDLRAAEAGWRVAVADLGVAEADRRPSLQLPGALTLGTAAGGAVLGQVTASVAAVLAMPLLDGGQRLAERDAALARERAAALAVQQTLQQALGEVDAALRATQNSRSRLAAQQRAVQEAAASVAQARTLYTAGLAGFLDVLDAQRSALERQQTLLRLQGDAARASVATFEALGLIDTTGAS